MNLTMDNCWEFVSPEALTVGDDIVIFQSGGPPLGVTKISDEAGGRRIQILDEDTGQPGAEHFLPADVQVLRRVDGVDGRAQGFLAWLASMDDPEDEVGLAERQTVNLKRIIDRAKGILGTGGNEERRQSDGVACLMAELSALLNAGVDPHEAVDGFPEELWEECRRRAAFDGYLGVEQIGRSLHDRPSKDIALGPADQGAVFTSILARSVLDRVHDLEGGPFEGEAVNDSLTELSLWWLLLRGYVAGGCDASAGGHWANAISRGDDGVGRVDEIVEALTKGLEILGLRGDNPAATFWRANTTDSEEPTSELIERLRTAVAAARAEFGGGSYR